MTTIRLLCLAAIAALAGTTNVGGISKGALVFTANPSGNWEVFLLRAGQVMPVQLTSTPLDERAPVLSPDGKRMAFATSDGALWVMDLASRGVTRLNLPKGIYGYPSWEAGGGIIVYTAYEYSAPHEDADLFEYSFKTGQSRLFLMQTGPQDYAAVSPNGTRVAYVSSVAATMSGSGSTVTQQIWIASLSTGKVAQIFIGSSHDVRPAWSKDGALLAVSSDRSGNAEIWIIDPDGRRAAEQITHGPGAKSSPTWSPDGTEIAYTSTASGKSALEIIDVRTKAIRALRPFGSRPVEVRDPNWR